MQNAPGQLSAAPDRSLIAVVGICLVLLASLTPHFGFVPTGTLAFIKAHDCRAKQQCLANDAVSWSVPSAHFTAAPPLPSAPHLTRGEQWTYSFCGIAAQLYNRPPPSA